MTRATSRNWPHSLPITTGPVNAEQAADALATIIRPNVSYDMRRRATYTFLAYTSQKDRAEATTAVYSIFERKYPNRDINEAMEELNSFTDLNIKPEIERAVQAAAQTRKTPWTWILILGTLGITALSTCNKQSSQPVHYSPAPTSTAAAVASAPQEPKLRPDSFEHLTDAQWAEATKAAHLSDAQWAQTTTAATAAPTAASALVKPQAIDCSQITRQLFGTPEEAARARTACGLKSPSVRFRAFIPVPAAHAHHGRNRQ
jgi:hypothetical protein